jgi:hypothetical protein
MASITACGSARGSMKPASLGRLTHEQEMQLLLGRDPERRAPAPSAGELPPHRDARPIQEQKSAFRIAQQLPRLGQHGRVAAAHRDEPALRPIVLEPVEQTLGCAIGEHGVEQISSPALNPSADLRGARVVDLGRVLDRVDLQVPLQVALGFLVERADERLCRRGLDPAILIESNDHVCRIVEPQAELAGHHPSSQKASMPR